VRIDQQIVLTTKAFEMTPFPKTTQILATLLTLAIVAHAVPAQAQRWVPAPAGRNPDAVVHDRGRCLTPDQVAANMQIAIKDHGYLDTFRVETLEGNAKARGWGVKSDNQWFKFVIELCQASFVQEIRLKGRPGNI
jgi:hypothetical protein